MRRDEILQKRFSVTNGRYFADYRHKNLNWYLGNKTSPGLYQPSAMDWFCYGDITDDDIRRIIPLLKEHEVLVLGWKDLGAWQGDYLPPYFEYNKVWMSIIKYGVIYDASVKFSRNHDWIFTINEDNSLNWERVSKLSERHDRLYKATPGIDGNDQHHDDPTAQPPRQDG